jgi:hypothetical protein
MKIPFVGSSGGGAGRGFHAPADSSAADANLGRHLFQWNKMIDCRNGCWRDRINAKRLGEQFGLITL